MPRPTTLPTPFRVAVMAVAMLVLGTTFTSGVPYWWCAPMARAQASHCCAREAEPDAGHAHATTPECCSHRRIAALPRTVESARAAGLGVGVALAVVPPVSLAFHGDAALLARPKEARGPPRAPPAQLYDLHRSYLV